MKKWLSILAALSVTGSTAFTVIACGNQATVASLTLDIVVTNRYLGSHHQEPTSQEVMLRVKDLNPSLNLKEVNVTKVEHGEAILTVKANSEVYTQGHIILYYNNEQSPDLLDLGKIVRQRDLGRFTEIKTPEELLAVIKEQNNDLVTTEVTLDILDNKTAILSAKLNSKIYAQGWLTITFYYPDPVDISSVIKIKGLGEFDHQPTDQEILAKLKELNPDLETEELEVVKNEKGEATVKVKDGSQVYLPDANGTDLTYTVVEKIQLSSVLTVTDLGTYDHVLTNEEILNNLLTLNPDLNLNEIHVNGSSEAKATIEVNPGSKVYFEGTIDITYKIDLRIDLDRDLTQRNLGEFDQEPNKTDVLVRLGVVNPDLKIDELEITDLANGQTTVKVKDGSTVYKPQSVSLSYTVKDSLQNFYSVIPTTALGSFDHEPTVAELLARLGELNPKLNLNEVEIINNQNGQATVKVKDGSTVYHEGSIGLTYNVDNRVALSSVITKTDLGEFVSSPTVDEIIAKLKELNPTLNEKEIQINSHDDNKAVIGVVNNSTVYKPETIELTYTFHQKTSLTDLGLVLDLGEFDVEPTDQEVLDRIKALNPTLNMNEILLVRNINGNVVIQVKDNSNYYLPGTIEFSYTVKQSHELPPLTKDLSIINLGQIKDNSPATILAEALARNANLKVDEVEVINITETQATIKVKDGSLVYAPTSTIVGFTLLQLPELSTVITTTNLGHLGTAGQNPVESEILNRVKFFNDSLKTEEVIISSITSTSARITVKPGSNIYNQTSFVDVSFEAQPLVDLSSLNLPTELGEFDAQPSIQQIRDRLLQLDPTLHVEDLGITTNSNGQVTITVKDGSQYYLPGSTTMNYSVHQWVELSSVVTTTNIGVFSKTPTVDEVLTKVTDLNQGFLRSEVSVTIDEVTNQATLTVNANSRVYVPNSQLVLHYGISSLISWDNDLTVTDLGTFSNGVPSANDLLVRLSSLNPNLKASEVTITIVDHKNATVSVNANSNYYLQATKNLTYDIKVDLTKAILFTDLGWYKDGTPILNVILEDLGKLNPGLDVSQLQSTLVSNNLNEPIRIQVKPRANSTVYDPNTSIIITLTAPVRIGRALRDRALGVVDWTKGEAAFLAELKRLNPLLDTTQINVININPNGLNGPTVDVIVKDTSKLYFTKEVVHLTFVI